MSGMVSNANLEVSRALASVYRAEWGQIVAILIRLLGDFDVAEEAAQEAFAAAVNQWQSSGIPDLPRAWIIRTARYKAIDRFRRRSRLTEKLEWYAASGLISSSEEPTYDSDEILDDRLRLIFTCCHPALAIETQVALTLRMLDWKPMKLPAPFSCPPQQWHSGSSVPSAKFGMPEFLIKCQTQPICLPGLMQC